MATRQLQHQPRAGHVRDLPAARCCAASTPRRFATGQAVHTVCELCIARAFDEGWIREGSSVTRLGRDAHACARARSSAACARAWRSGRTATAPAAGRGDRARRPPRARRARRPARPARARCRPLQRQRAAEADRRRDPLARRALRPRRPPHDGVLVEILVAWELCWYRFEADLEGDIVHRRGQGYELSELDGEPRRGQRRRRSRRLALRWPCKLIGMIYSRRPTRTRGLSCSTVLAAHYADDPDVR